jgi:hypothetical protein
MCEKILDIDLQAFEDNEFPSLVIRDLRQSLEHANMSYIKGKDVRFYAGAPLISPSGAIVGSLCVFDDVARPDGLSHEHRHNLRDIAQSIMDYLHTYTIKDQLWRGERFTRGLISFSEGAEDLLPFRNAAGNRESQNAQEHRRSSQALDSLHNEKGDAPNIWQQTPTSNKLAIARSKSEQPQSLKNLQDRILPTDARTMFSRAANVMMASSDLDGVVVLDASVAANKTRQRSASGDYHSTGTVTEEGGDSFPSLSSSSEGGSSSRGRSRGSSSKTSDVLGSATRTTDGYHENDASTTFGSLLESNLSRMLHDYPNGKILTFGKDGLPLSSTDDAATSSTSEISSHEPPKRRSARGRSSRISHAIQAMLPGVRSVAFVPFWDYE